jgi:hypothetical protein
MPPCVPHAALTLAPKLSASLSAFLCMSSTICARSAELGLAFGGAGPSPSTSSAPFRGRANNMRFAGGGAFDGASLLLLVVASRWLLCTGQTAE